MILKNFNLTDSYTEIIFGENLCDLHNCYEWLDSIRNEQQQTLKLKFKKRTDEFVDPNTPTEFLILFKNIHEIESKDHDSDYAEEYLVQDGTTIDMIGFSNSTIPIDSVLDKHESDGLSCLSFITVTGKVLRICADSAEVVVEN